jgi:hypothetical protein
MIYAIIKGKYRRHEIAAAQVWEYADAGKITLAQAFAICGPRPKEETEEEGGNDESDI